MTHTNPNEAFNKAIEAGKLSEHPAHSKYAGNYMYMGTNEGGKDMFKNVITREYDV